MIQDRGVESSTHTLSLAPGQLRIGAQAASPPAFASAGTRLVEVATPDAARTALASAEPGDVITFLPGKYRFDGSYLRIDRPGTTDRQVTVRAAQPGAVTLEFAMVEGFLVSAPYWRFENLTIVGACTTHSMCEHAFHVVGNAHHFTARNNTIVDFNSHFKINAQGELMPDHGVMEANTITNNSVRQTASPVDVIDIVAASHWTMRKNFITDFFKGEGNRTSYGGFAKGAGAGNVFEQNIVLCEYRLRNPGAITVGLSLGGGGTGPQFCRDKRCSVEQDGGIVRGNLIAACSDDGIYLNKASNSSVTHNTLIDTVGISVRFAASSAIVEGNLVDGKICARDQATLHAADNLQTSIIRLYAGSHPVREILDLATPQDFVTNMPRRAPGTQTFKGPDLCGTTAAGPRAYGAFERFADCLR